MRLTAALQPTSNAISWMQKQDLKSLNRTYINSHPGNAEQFIRIVLPKWHIIFCHAGNHARAATGTLVQIDDHSELFAFFVFHQNPLELTIFN